MNNTGASVFNIAADAAAAVSMAKAMLEGVETYVEYHFQDGQDGERQSVIYHNAGNIQVMLGVMSNMLCKVEAKIEKLDRVLHEAAEKGPSE